MQLVVRVCRRDGRTEIRGRLADLRAVDWLGLEGRSRPGDRRAGRNGTGVVALQEEGR